MYICIYTHMYIHLNICMYIYTHACIYTHIYICSCTCMCVYVYMSHLPFWDKDTTNLSSCKLPWYICSYVNMMYISMYTLFLNNVNLNPSCQSLALIYVYMYICIFTYIHIYTYVCVYVLMYVTFEERRPEFELTKPCLDFSLKHFGLYYRFAVNTEVGYRHVRDIFIQIHI